MKLRHAPASVGPILRTLRLYHHPQRHELFVHGLKRSGNHAVINWLLRQYPGWGVFLNDLKPGEGLLRTGPADRIFFDNRTQAEVAQGHGISFVPLLLQSFEDKSFEALQQNRREQSRRSRDILLLRDPFNLFASRFQRRHQKFYQNRDGYRAQMKALWKAYAREFLGETQFLRPDKVCVNYNRWFTQPAYRQQLAGELGLIFTDAGIADVPHYGGGSSFEGTIHTGRAQDMKVLHRWESFREDEDFRSVFHGEAELLELSQRIFGELPGTSQLVGGVAER